MPEFNPGGAADLDQAVKLRYEANPDTNAFSDAEKAKLAGIAPGATAYVHPDHSGDVTSTGDGVTAIAAGAVTNAKLGAMAAGRIKGRSTAGSGAPEDLTGTEVTQLLDTFTPAAKGLAPASGGGTAAFLRADGTWAAPPAGSGDVTGPASSPDTALARFDGATGKVLQASGLAITDADELILPTVAAPAPPAAGRVSLFGRSVGGRMLPAFMGPTGFGSALQPLLARNTIGWWQANGNATSATSMGIITASGGTATARNVATTNRFTRTRRLGYVSASTAGSNAHLRHNAVQFSTGTGSGDGGFLLVIRYGFSAVVASMRAFAGMQNTVSVTNVNPSAMTQCVGLARIDGSTSLHIVYGGTAAQTPIDLGATFPADTANTDLYDLALFASPGEAGVVHYQASRLTTGHVASGTLSGDSTALPAASVLLTPVCWVNNNTTAAAVAVDMVSIYVETGF
jgi:hypothetical protein